MKSYVKKLSLIIATSIAISSFTFNASADVEKSKEIFIKARQERCIEGYENLLLTFEENGSKEIDYPDEFAGAYFDRESGKTTIYLTDIEKSGYYDDFFPKSIIEFKEVDYSLEELTTVYQLLSENMVEENISIVSIIESSNSLEVSVESDRDKSNLMDFLESKGYEIDMIRFTENSAPLKLDSNYTETENSASKSSSTNYAYTGDALKASLYGSVISVGTIGANAYNPNTNQYGVITAGHIGSDSTFSSYYNSSNVLMNNGSSIISMFSGECDAAFIPFNSTNTFLSTTQLKNSGISSCVYKKQYILSPAMLGIEVVKYGATTGQKRGIITSLSTFPKPPTILKAVGNMAPPIPTMPA